MCVCVKCAEDDNGKLHGQSNHTVLLQEVELVTKVHFSGCGRCVLVASCVVSCGLGQWVREGV